MPQAGYTKRRSAWTREETIEKLQEWRERYGAAPVASEWNPTDCLRAARRSADRARAWSGRAERFYEGEYPWTGTVFKLFGGWNTALRAAGLNVAYKGRRRADLKEGPGGDLDADELRRLIDEAEEAILHNRGDRLRHSLCKLADQALAWAEGIPDERP